MSTKHQTALKTVYWSVLANLILAVVKGLSGHYGNSYALLADAIESSSDVFASLLLLFGLKYAARPADDNHPYGHGKLEPLLTFIIVTFLIISAIVIGYRSIINIGEPHALPSPFTLYVLGGIIIYKEIAYRWVKKKGKEIKSTTLEAEAWHHRSDAITSIFALVGISIALIMGRGYENADDWAALIAACFILYNSYLIFRPALGEVLDEHLHEELEEEIRNTAKKVSGVIGTEKCKIRKSGMSYFVDLHLIVDGTISVKEGHEIAHQVKLAVREEMSEVADVLIHVEPEDAHSVFSV